MISFTVWFLATFALCRFTVTYADDDKVLAYTSEDFHESVKANNHFVMFYAPWCGHSKRLQPIWKQLADMLNDDEGSKVSIAKVDCTTNRDLCAQHDVTGYPTLRFFKLGNAEESVKFRGSRDLPSLTSFINEQLGIASGMVDDTSMETPVPVNGLTELTQANFAATTAAGNHFIKFFAPWCGHCQKLAPTWEQLAERFESVGEVNVGKVDCTVHRTVCNDLDIKGYPTLLFIKDGTVIEKYSGQRTLEELERFVQRLAGSPAPVHEEQSTKKTEEVLIPLLNADTFEKGIASGITFVKFFAPWCGHCKRLAPTWTELAHKLKDSSYVRIVKVDCTQPDSKELCNQQEVEGFPTLLVYRDGKKITEYNGSRNVDDMHQFIATYFQKDEL